MNSIHCSGCALNNAHLASERKKDMKIEEYLDEIVKNKNLIIHHRKVLGGKIHEPFEAEIWVSMALKMISSTDLFNVYESEAILIYRKCQKYHYSNYYKKRDKVEISLWVLKYWRDFSNATKLNFN